MDANARIDPLDLARALIRRPSVTPTDAGALDVLQTTLEGLGFICHRLVFSEPGTADVDNLYARFGDGRPNFCFAGHTDVVPVGDAAAWRTDPFAAELIDGALWGRGASDMKAAIACFVAAAAGFLIAHGDGFGGSISLLITGDEEGPAINGTEKVLAWLEERGETIDHCLVGEPTNPGTLGEMIKNGRRGTLGGKLVVRGTQGHVAYPHLADNPIPRLLAMLGRLQARAFDDGNAHFQATNLEITTIDVGNAASNVIPAEATAAFNIRFNTSQRGDDLCDWLRRECADVGGDYDLSLRVGGEPFLTAPGDFTDLLRQAVEAETGVAPELSTTGGTSDARFIKNHCPVVEFGMVGRTMHKVDEHIAVADIETLTRIYRRVLQRYFT